MKQTLGKRIAENRKRLRLTQDALAEKLGITAQAISKWENDQSCPDITILPQLAEIFGTSSDALLGVEAESKASPVHETEVVDEDDSGIHFSLNSDNEDNYVFQMDRSGKGTLTFAIFILFVGAITLLSKVYSWEVGFWGILWPSALLIFGLAGVIRKLSIFGLGCTIFGGYSLIANLDIWKLDIADDLIFPVMILLFGIGFLIDALRKPKKPVFRVTRNGKDARKTTYSCNSDTDRFSCDLSFGEKYHQVNLPVLSGGEASVSFGQLTIDLCGCENVREHCSIQANCSFGELEIKVPRRFRVEPNSGTSFGGIDISGHPDPDAAGIIYLDARASFGEIEIRYI